MGALGHYLESEGIATTGISLVREHTEAMQPPRFLWVPFPLGRPLGAPGDAAFQHRVIRAALSLLEAPAGPVLAGTAVPVDENAFKLSIDSSMEASYRWIESLGTQDGHSTPPGAAREAATAVETSLA